MLRLLTLAAGLLALSGCQVIKNAGFYSMDDRWCTKHPDADESRCADHVPKQELTARTKP